MKFLIDINHPAHVHYFRNMIKIMENNGHQFRILSRNKEIEHYLLIKYKIDFFSRGAGKKSTIGKIGYFFYATFFLLKQLIKFKPAMVISFGTPYPAIAGKILGIPHISINDTEHAQMHHLLTDPFSNIILTPTCYTKDLGNKQIRFNGYMELSYLQKKYFRPDDSILKLLNINERQKFIVFRFVSWNAVHDLGHNGITLKNKIKAVKEFSKYARVFISSESELPGELKKYKIDFPPERMHDVLAFATLFYGESATMASECACLGTPAIYLDNDGRGYTDEEEDKYGLVFNYSESEKDQLLSINKGIELLKNENIKKDWQKKTETMISDKIDVTAFFVWFFENYPSSGKILKENPDYQLKFN